jgi:hypothetical protein
MGFAHCRGPGAPIPVSTYAPEKWLFGGAPDKFPVVGPSISATNSKWDRKFESRSLQQGVRCELDFGRDAEGERSYSSPNCMRSNRSSARMRVRSSRRRSAGVGQREEHDHTQISVYYRRTLSGRWRLYSALSDRDEA